MWKDLIENKKEWIGGKLIDYGDKVDRHLSGLIDRYPRETSIVDIILQSGRYISWARILTVRHQKNRQGYRPRHNSTVQRTDCRFRD